jgi:glyoxylase-like metal-dependent hydrolase (beta-lactamase superfamily II)
VPLRELPAVERLTLARVTRLPDWHPEHRNFEPFPVHAWVVRHPDGVILVDTGIGEGSEIIDSLYGPELVALGEALATIDLDIADIAAVVLSHLHFDHCGQQRLVDAPVFVQTTEYGDAQQPRYTIPAWAAIPQERLRLVDGDEEIADGVHLVATPGHTPGHQSVVIEAGGRRVVLGAQCAFRADEVRTGEPAPTNLHDEWWRDAARESLARIRAYGPATVHLSHDTAVVHVAETGERRAR